MGFLNWWWLLTLYTICFPFSEKWICFPQLLPVWCRQKSVSTEQWRTTLSFLYHPIKTCICINFSYGEKIKKLVLFCPYFYWALTAFFKQPDVECLCVAIWSLKVMMSVIRKDAAYSCPTWTPCGNIRRAKTTGSVLGFFESRICILQFRCKVTGNEVLMLKKFFELFSMVFTLV